MWCPHWLCYGWYEDSWGIFIHKMVNLKCGSWIQTRISVYIAMNRLQWTGIGVAHWTEAPQILKAKYPSYPFVDRCSSRTGDDIPHSMDTSNILKIGVPPFKTLEQMFDDCIESFQEKGFL